MKSLLNKLVLVSAAIALPIFLISCASPEQKSSAPSSPAATPASLYANASPLDLRLSNWPYPYPLK